MISWRRWALLLTPAAVGLALALALAGDRVSASILVVRVQAEASLVAAITGVGLSILALGLWWLQQRQRGALDHSIATERRAQTAARQRFLRRLDHELKNPLTAMRAGLANLDAGQPTATSSSSSLTTVRWQVERLSRLVGELRKLADLETSQIEVAPVDLSKLAHEAVDLAQSAPGRNGRAIASSIQQAPWRVSPIAGDRDLLLLALYNMLDNALKFSDPTARVELRLRDDGARVVIEVADTGRGIAPDDLPSVTEELYRGHDSQGIEGSGLGLALVQRIAQLHHGELAIRSRLGQGTVVALALPLRRA